MHEQALAINRLELLLPWLAAAAAKDQLRLEAPLLRDPPDFLGFGVDERVVVLQVGAGALGLEREPQRILVHGGRVLGPDGELVGVEGEGLLQGVDGLGVLEEEDLGDDVSGAVEKKD
jgi:hypothetical protein